MNANWIASVRCLIDLTNGIEVQANNHTVGRKEPAVRSRNVDSPSISPAAPFPVVIVVIPPGRRIYGAPTAWKARRTSRFTC